MLIEKEALLSKFDPDGRNLNPIEVRSIIVQAPTVDAVPVRCGECQGWEPVKRKIHKCDLCRMFGFGPGDYCSLGHRKDGEK